MNLISMDLKLTFLYNKCYIKLGQGEDNLNLNDIYNSGEKLLKFPPSGKIIKLQKNLRKFLQSLDENEDLSKETPTLIPKLKTSKDIINKSPKE